MQFQTYTSPHTGRPNRVDKVMLQVVLALIPGTAALVFYRNMMYKPYLDTLKRLAPDIKQKTVVVLDFVLSVEAKKLSLEVQSVLAGEGFAVFPSVNRAALALGRFINYHDRR